MNLFSNKIKQLEFILDKFMDRVICFEGDVNYIIQSFNFSVYYIEFDGFLKENSWYGDVNLHELDQLKGFINSRVYKFKEIVKENQFSEFKCDSELMRSGNQTKKDYFSYINWNSVNLLDKNAWCNFEPENDDDICEVTSDSNIHMDTYNFVVGNIGHNTPPDYNQLVVKIDLQNQNFDKWPPTLIDLWFEKIDMYYNNANVMLKCAAKLKEVLPENIRLLYESGR